MNFCTSGHARCFRLLGSAAFCILASIPNVYAQDAATLRERHASLLEQLTSNPFHRPLHLESSENADDLKGDIYALIEQPYAVVRPALQGMDHWCEMLILHQNVKSCRATTRKAGNTLRIYIGSKFDQPLSDAYLFEFLYKVAANKSDYLQVLLNAEKGSLGMSHCRIMLEVVALDSGRSFLHLSYSYTYSMFSHIAMQSYLATTGRKKIGFSIVGNTTNGQPVYMGGMRGIVERNTMRYYLAIEAYLGALSSPTSQQLEKRLHDWYAGVERYPAQLHELDHREYLDMKHREIQRQNVSVSAGADFK